jgi:hypothetical protein
MGVPIYKTKKFLTGMVVMLLVFILCLADIVPAQDFIEIVWALLFGA